ncbi:hypothetical protein GCM10020367_24090 [Streptomyces sannanensis]|uniref:Uncharacterized protein n=1 Tax=Streptomyces sannanensis TaxID=285536 RepID=A0ABP6S9Y2_9ACTN
MRRAPPNLGGERHYAKAAREAHHRPGRLMRLVPEPDNPMEDHWATSRSASAAVPMLVRDTDTRCDKERDGWGG